jgi:2-hydroxy-3-oxopropionate reductase
MSSSIAFIGLGAMGLPMANTLARSGLRVRAWSRKRPAGLDATVTWCEDGLACVNGCDFVILMLTDAHAVSEVLFERGFVAGMRRGTIVVDMGTTGIEHARATAARLRPLGIDFADAPVSGGTDGASRAALTIFVGADERILPRLSSVLARMGILHHLGPVGSGQAAKLANQIVVGINIAAVAEAVLFAESVGIDASKLLVALERGFADSTVLRTHGPRIATRDFSAAGALRLHLKDLKLAEAAWPGDFGDLRHAERVMRDFLHLADSGDGDLDHSAYIRTYEMAAEDELRPERPDFSEVLAETEVIQHLAGFRPTVVGTPPLRLDLAASDIDVICQYSDPAEFWSVAYSAFGNAEGFEAWQWIGSFRATVIRFVHRGWFVQIFGSPEPIEDQNGWLHFEAERRLLMLWGEPLRRRVMALRRQGLKTEPAFARALGIPGDPYEALASLIRGGGSRTETVTPCGSRRSDQVER